MDEELMNLTTEDNIDVFVEEVVESEVEIEDLEQDIETEESVSVVDVESVDEIEISLDESAGWVGGDNTKHYSLSGRDEPDQHPIKSIIGLRDELNDIKALQTVYSDKIGYANYYKWNIGSYDEAGYFVSLAPNTSTIQICDGNDIFGVTVDDAGFIGGQDEDTPRNRNYGLVVTSGLVDVRCESDIDVGDYIISNNQGVATKTTSDCGYKVVAKTNKSGIDYATISLGVQACTTDIIGRNVHRIKTRLDDAEINIASAINVAQAAYNKSIDSDAIAEEVKKQMQDAMDKIDDIEDIVGSTNESTVSTSAIAVQARAIAESAVIAAETARNEAVSSANNALDKANKLEETVEPINKWEYTNPVTGETHKGAEYLVEYIEDGLSTKVEMQTVNKLDEENKLLIEKNAESYSQLISSVDKYSVGEISQAYGLTLDQAKSILKDGMVYIPTESHQETYSNVTYSFTKPFYYVWTVSDSNEMWLESVDKVWLGNEQPAGTAYTYWYDDESLFTLQDGQWIKVAMLAGNISNRMTSMIRQDVDKIALHVANTVGSVASVEARLTNTESKVNSYAYWPQDKNMSRFNLSTIDQSANQDGSSLVLAVVHKDGEQIINGASIVLNQDDKGSFISLDADAINLEGYTTINEGFRIDADGYMHATQGGTIGGWTIGENKISCNPASGVSFNINSANNTADPDWISATFKDETTFKVSKQGVLNATGAVIEGKITATSGTIGGCDIDENGNLQVKNANIVEKLTANQIDVDSLTVSNILVKNGSSQTLLSAGNNTVQLGGWNVGINSLYSTYDNSPSRVFMCTGTSKNYTIGGYTDKWYFGAGSSTGPGFGVSTSGVLCASGAKISGTVTAEEGRFGAWEIGEVESGGSSLQSITASDEHGRVHLTPWGVIYVPPNENDPWYMKTWANLLAT